MNLKISRVISILVLSLIAVLPLLSCKGSTKEYDVSYIYYMYSQNQELRIVEKKDNEGKEPIKIFFDNKDYTPHAQNLISRYNIMFACNDLIIFGKGKAIIKGDEIACQEGVIFIPQAQKINIITAKDIIFNEVKKTIDCSHAGIEEISLTDNKKVVKALDISKTIDINNLDSL